MKKTMIIKISIMFIILSCCTTVTAVNPPIHKTTLDYQEYEYISFDSSDHVNLTFISSESFDHTAILVEKIMFYPTMNSTKYKFTSTPVTPSYKFTPGIKKFIYQDVNTGQLYSINIDYSNIQIPQHPAEELYTQLQTQHISLTDKYNNLLNNYTTLNQTLHNISQILALYTNLTNTTYEQVTMMIYNDTITLKNNINQLNQQIQQLKNQYTNIYNMYNHTEEAYNDLYQEYTELDEDYINLTETYKILESDYQNKTFLFSQYQLFERNMHSYQDIFYYNGKQYHTLYYYQNRVEQLENENNMLPVYILLAIIITILCCYLLYRQILKQKPLSPIEMDTDYNYPREASIFDRFSMGNLKKHFKNHTTTQQTTEPIELEPVIEEDKYNIIKKELDNKIMNIEYNITNIEKNIDKLLKKTGEKK